MILSGADQTRFPKSTRYIRYVLPTVITIPVIVRAMARFGQLTRTQFREALGWGNPPTIRPVVAPTVNGALVCARFTHSVGNNTIELDEQIFTDFEAGRGYLSARAGNVPALGVNILHEMVHWGDNADGVFDLTNDAGDLFELAVYGRNLSC